jgi:predicted Zn-dependent protease
VGAAAASNTAARLFFVHTRAEENAADQSGMRYLIRAGIDPQAMVQVMDIFRGQELVSASRQDPYARTHPLSRDRFRVIKRLADAHNATFVPDQTSEYWFQRAKAKLSAFQRSPKWTLNRAGESGFDDIKAMRQAVAYHRQSDLNRAIAAMDRAIAIRPDDGYFYELKGQILLESRQFQAAVKAYAKAAELEPKNALILGAYGRSLMAVGQQQEAIALLKAAHDRDGRDPRVMRDLAQAYASIGDNGMASLATAERYAMVGRMKDAGLHAKRASDLLPRGSTAWRQAQDVLIAAEEAAKRRK